MVRIGSSYSIDVPLFIVILRNILPEREDVDSYMIYNVRLRARRRNLEMEAANIVIDTQNLMAPL